MNRRVSLTVLAALFLAGGVGICAQVLLQRTEPPVKTAAQEPWFLDGDPIVFNGVVFHRAGAQVFFNGDVMVRAGTYDGTPLYVDTTLEPNSIVYVPVDGKMMQPYERLRDGVMAGTTGSRAPSFPVTPAPAAALEFGERTYMAPGSPAGPESGAPERVSSAMGYETGAEAVSVGTGALVPSMPGAATVPAAPVRGVWQSARAPQSTLGVWIEYDGARWQACGAAELLDTATFRQVGSYRGYPVFSRQGVAPGERIYVPSREGFVAPYWRGSVSRNGVGECEPVIEKTASPD